MFSYSVVIVLGVVGMKIFVSFVGDKEGNVWVEGKGFSRSYVCRRGRRVINCLGIGGREDCI